MGQPSQFLIEGIDRMGKSTLIQGLLDTLGYHLVVHYEKPKKLKFYEQLCNRPLMKYQFDLYAQMFDLIREGQRIIFDRAHLGERVYAPMYRGYDPTFLDTMERWNDTSSARLVLLTTSDFSFIEDDGKSIDFSKKEVEQESFIKAFNRSSFEDKVLVDVCNGKGGYKTPEAILAEVLKR